MEHFGKYQLIRKLATGGMAEVFLAKSAGPMGFEKILVVKRILPHLAEDPTFVQKFLAEAKLAARLDHPNVVQIFDLGENDGGYFIAMEYIDGPSLRTVVRKIERTNVALNPAFCAKVISMACEGLAYAHDFRDPESGKWLGIIHRDISPENILVSRTGSAKVVDFGLAKASEESETKSKILFGKYWYMAPEQIRRKDKLDRRVDVYALGVVLYELLTSGQKPFDAQGEVEMMRAVLQEKYVPATKRRRDLPPALEKILQKVLAKREQRYPDCLALQADLDEFILSTGAPMGTQQITRILTDLGTLPQSGSSGQHASPPPPAPPPQAPVEHTRATPSVRMAERNGVELSKEAAYAGEEVEEPEGSFNPDATSAEATGEDFLSFPVQALPGRDAQVFEEDDPRNEKTLLDLNYRDVATRVSRRDPATDLSVRDVITEVPLREAPNVPRREVAPDFSRHDTEGDEPTGSAELRAPGASQRTVLDRKHSFQERDTTQLEPLLRGTYSSNATAQTPRRAKPVMDGRRWLLLAAAVTGLLLLGVGTAGIVRHLAEPESAPELHPDAAHGPPASLPVPHSSAAMPDPAAPPGPAQTLELAHVKIATEPPADVRVNGVLLGHAPVDLVDREPGELRVEITNKRLGFRKEVRLELMAGDNGTRTITAELLPVQLRVRPRAHVSVDDRELGDTGGTTLELFEGWHKIHLVNRDLNQDVVKDFIVTPGQSNIFTYDLRH